MVKFFVCGICARVANGDHLPLAFLEHCTESFTGLELPKQARLAGSCAPGILSLLAWLWDCDSRPSIFNVVSRD